MIEIDKSLISDEALRGLAHDFVMQSMGNEFDEQPIDEKISITIAALERGELKIIFSEVHEEARLMSREELMKVKKP